MSNPLRKPQRGEPLEIAARVWGSVLEDYLTGPDSGGGTPKDLIRNPAIVRVRNDSGRPLGRGEVLGVDGAMIQPASNADLFRRHVFLKGVVSTTAHRGKFCVLLEPIDRQRIGRAFIAGACYCKIEVLDETDEWAEAAGTGDKYTLISASSGGSARILGKDPGTGEQMAYVLLNAGMTIPIGQYQGMFWGVVAANQNGFAYPFAVNTVG